MKKIYCGSSGQTAVQTDRRLSDIPIAQPILDAFLAFCGTDLPLRPAQENALFTQDILNCRENLILATPTNSGKSLLAYLLLFQQAVNGGVCVLAEPLRALAYEKSEELKQIAQFLKQQSNLRVDIRITTGDYRLTDEFMHTRPVSPKGQPQGQIIVATPERLDAISRVPENRDWFSRISLFCLDEAHLIGDPHRGAALELLIAFLRSLPSPPQIVLMSATVRNPEDLADWLSPCRILSNVPRYPPLRKWVYTLAENEDADQILFHETQALLQDPGASILIFVYQTASAEKLACCLASKLSGKNIPPHDLEGAIQAGVSWFHGNMCAATKERIVQAMSDRRLRVVVSTTALSMGINLPATHVFVRDITFSGFGDLDISDLLQMIGRAGRGNTPGTGVILLTGSNTAKEGAMVAGLSSETLPQLRSQLIPVPKEGRFSRAGDVPGYTDAVGSQILGILHRCREISLSGLEAYLQNTWGGKHFSHLQAILQRLTSWKLVYRNEDTNEYCLTRLGKLASQCYLPPVTAANLGQLHRDLLTDSPNGQQIAKLNPIDFLIILCLISEEAKPVSRYHKALPGKIHSYMEALPLEEKSYLYPMWILPSPEALYGSAHVVPAPADAAKQVTAAVYTAMFLYDLSRGLPPERLKSLYCPEVEEIQEKLRDNALWILRGMEQILEVRSFYFHLKENCGATPRQIQQADRALASAARTVFRLIANLKFRSSLGELVRGIKRVFPHADSYPGEGTLRRLESAGLTSVRALVGKTPAELVSLGIGQAYADMIVSYLKKRMS